MDEIGALYGLSDSCQTQKEINLSQPGLERLKNRDEYALYFNQLHVIFSMLLAVFQCQVVSMGSKSCEPKIVAEFLRKLLGSIRALRRKYTYDPEHTLVVDLSDSGFPSFQEINGLEINMQLRDQKLSELPTMHNLKAALLDLMFEQKLESIELLGRASERYFYEKLDPNQLLLTFTPGEVIPGEEGEEFRRYVFSWSGYDFRTNRPNICIMAFDQDVGSKPLEEAGPGYERMLEIIRAEGSRFPPLGVLAIAIDSNLKDIHPKSLKRICLGPICTKPFAKEPPVLHDLLLKYSEKDSDFILQFKDEIVISQEQRRSKSPFSFGQLREIFFIPETNLECYQSKTSQVHHYMLLPHFLRQIMDRNGEFSEFKTATKLTYDEEKVYAGQHSCSLPSNKGGGSD